MRRSLVSISSNIAKGNSRMTA
ncbi:MAG TPA: hypothetical protein P5264_05415 [Mangrovimonas sp.]|nr:hypothetical protein [Mangrovimonas sp.]